MTEAATTPAPPEPKRAPRRRRLKRWLLGLAAIVLLGFAGLNLMAYRHAWAMMHYTRTGVAKDVMEQLSFGQKLRALFWGVNLPRPEPTTLPSALAAECRSLTIVETNGIKLGAWYCPGPAGHPLVILFHGYASAKTGTLPNARAFLDLGYSVLLVDFRGSGDSSESYTTVGYSEADDVAAAFQYARNELHQSRIILFGQSMGAVAVIRAVGRLGIQPEAIIVESVFDTLLNTVRHRFEKMGVPAFPSAQLLVFWGGHQNGFDGFAHNPVDYARDIHCPALFLHGATDSRAQSAEARRVFEAVPAPKLFKEFSGMSHESGLIRFPEEWKRTVVDFLRDAANQPPVAKPPGQP